MHPEIEKLIEMALADGQVTEKEREIILRKAEKLGLDVDEVEMYLEGKIHQLETSKPKLKEKVGNIKTCPACGASVKSFEIKCEDCGHEFRDIQSSNLIRDFFNRLDSIVHEESNRKIELSGIDKLLGDDGPWKIEAKIVQRQIPLISSFPVPNSKEDIIEFLLMSFPEATKKIGFFASFSGTTDSHKGELKKAYLSKCKQIIYKARILFKDDIQTLEEIEYYAKQLKI